MQAITNKDLDLNTKIALRSSKDKFFPAIYGCGKNIFGRPQNQNLKIEKKKQSNDYDLKIGEYLLFTHQIIIHFNINRQVNGQYEREPTGPTNISK